MELTKHILWFLFLSLVRPAGLVVEVEHQEQLYNGGFDGMYTYFASDTFRYGSTPSRWSKISSYCKMRQLLWAPRVGPGYIDTEVRRLQLPPEYMERSAYYLTLNIQNWNWTDNLSITESNAVSWFYLDMNIAWLVILRIFKFIIGVVSLVMWSIQNGEYGTLWHFRPVAYH